MTDPLDAGPLFGQIIQRAREGRGRKLKERAWDQTRDYRRVVKGGMIVFRFRESPEEPVQDMLQHFGFSVEGKEAWQANDPAGRIAADKAAWWIREMCGDDLYPGR